MSALIGTVKGPHCNSPNDAAETWCSLGGVELRLLAGADGVSTMPNGEAVIARSLAPIAARNLAALLVRASEEVERMRDRAAKEDRTPIEPVR